jgi:PEP-CTERM motif
MRRLGIVASVLFAVEITSSVPVAASPILTIDQSQTQTPGPFDTFFVVLPGESVAQSFVPTLSGLDAVELFTDTPLRTELSLNIRSGTFNGPIVGTSLLTPLPQGIAIPHFDFASTVPLTPGALYFIEFTRLPLGPNIGGKASNPYPAGAFLHDGVETKPGQDAYFVEGLHASSAVPEPSTVLLVLSGLVGVVVRRRLWPTLNRLR